MRLRWLLVILLAASVLAGLTVVIVYRATLTVQLQPQEPDLPPLSWPPTT